MTDQDGIISDQAQTIARLERELAECQAQAAAMREGLEPFAQLARRFQLSWESTARNYKDEGKTYAPWINSMYINQVVTLGNLRGAEAALSSTAGVGVMRVVALMRELIEAIDKNALEMNSPDIVTCDENPHPWHQEWEHYAREALAAREGK